MTEKILKKSTDTIPTGTIEVNETINLTTIKTLTITKSRKKSGNDSVYKISVASMHPWFGDISFSFDYNPISKKVYSEFHNVKGNNICMGIAPHGEIKDIIIAAVSDESYAYQLSKKRETWCHAERDPNQIEYLLWHLLYYGRYSPRLQWKLPPKCEQEKLYEKHKCNLCNGMKCDYIKKICTVCGNATQKQCPMCLEPVCDRHSHCKNGHYNLTPTGIWRGTCESCGTKCPIENNECTCGGKRFGRF